MGVVFGLLSSVFVALNGIYTKKAMEVDEMDSVKLTLHVNCNASFLLLIPAIFTGQVRYLYVYGIGKISLCLWYRLGKNAITVFDIRI